MIQLLLFSNDKDNNKRPLTLELGDGKKLMEVKKTWAEYVPFEAPRNSGWSAAQERLTSMWREPLYGPADRLFWKVPRFSKGRSIMMIFTSMSCQSRRADGCKDTTIFGIVAICVWSSPGCSEREPRPASAACQATWRLDAESGCRPRQDRR